MDRSQARTHRFTVLPAAFAIIFNIIAGPLLPLAASAATNIPDYSQCQIGNPKPAALDCDSWINGILNATHNDYAEDEVVPQRLVVDFDTTGAHSVQISYMARKDSGTQNHAYDYLATWNYTYVNADKCQDLNPASLCIPNSDPTASTFPIPSDPNSVTPGGPQPTSAHELPQGDRQFVMYGGDITGTSGITHTTDPAEPGSDYGVITINFDVTDADGRVMLLFGGHLSSGLGPRGWGAGLGAGSISGGPYHIRLTKIDAESIGNRDNQIMSNAITPLFPALQISKTADAATVNAGSNIGFTITVTNNGPGVANAVTLNDPLPGGTGVDWTIDPAYAGPGTCSITGAVPTETLTCAFGNLADDASATVHVQSGTTLESCKAYPNTATADADNFDPITASATTTVQCPDLDITKTADADTVNAGSNIGFTITVTNNGPGVATNATLSDPLPGGTGVDWTIDPVYAGPGTCSITGALPTETLTCAFGDLADDASATVHVQSATTFASCKAYPNTATADADNHAAITASATTTVQCPALQISKTADAATVNAGSNIGFTITVTNNGPGAATNATLNDPLPFGTGVSWAISPAYAGPGTCSITGAPPTQTLSCAFGNLADDASATVHVQSATTFDSCKAYPNTASADADNFDPITASATTTVLCPDLDITKTADAATVNAGSNIGFTITVTNNGPGVATNATLSDPLPAGTGVSWAISPAYAGPGTCSITGAPPTQTLSCAFGDLADDASAMVHVQSATTFASCKAYPNTATADADNHAAITASATTTVQCPNLTAIKDADGDSPEMVSAGQQIGFTISVMNSSAAGTGVAKDVELDDLLPAGTGINWAISPAYAGPGTCEILGSPPAETLHCEFGDMAPGASASVHVVSSTTQASCKEYPNEASITATNHPELNPSDSVTVQCPGLNIAKTATDDDIIAGETAEFEIVVWNLGPGTATSVTLDDVLPVPTGSDIEWVEVDDPGDACDVVNNVLHCDFGDLGVTTMLNSPARVTVAAETDRDDCELLDNEAFADATNSEPPISATASILVHCPLVEIVKVNDQPDPVLPGTVVSYTLNVTVSDGPADDVLVVDTLPPGLDDPTSISNGGVWDGTTRTITWDLGDDVPNGEIVLTYQAAVSLTAQHGAELTNVAIVTSSDSQCPDEENVEPECQDDSTVTVRVPTLVIDKAADVELITRLLDNQGNVVSITPDTVTWTLTYTLTNGPVTNAVITEPIPAGLTYVADSADPDADFDDVTNELTWTFPLLEESGFVTFETTVDEDAPVGEIVNVATIESDETPLDEGEDSIRIVEETTGGGTGTPTQSIPNTAMSASQSGGLAALLFAFILMTALGGLAYANVTAVRRRR